MPPCGLHPVRRRASTGGFAKSVGGDLAQQGEGRGSLLQRRPSRQPVAGEGVPRDVGPQLDGTFRCVNGGSGDGEAFEVRSPRRGRQQGGALSRFDELAGLVSDALGRGGASAVEGHAGRCVQGGLDAGLKIRALGLAGLRDRFREVRDRVTENADGERHPLKAGVRSAGAAGVRSAECARATQPAT